MAKRFVFRLDPLLTVRNVAQKQQQRIVAECIRGVQRCQGELVDVRTQLSRTVAQARNTRREPRIDVGMELQEQRWRSHLKRRIQWQQRQLQSLEGSLADARQELAKRSRDVKVIEKLRLRRLQAHLENLRRAERIESDELATQMFLRRRREAEALNAPD